MAATAFPALLGLILGTSQILQRALSKHAKAAPYIGYFGLWSGFLYLALDTSLIEYPLNVALAIAVSVLFFIFLIWVRRPEGKSEKNKSKSAIKKTDAQLARGVLRFLWLNRVVFASACIIEVWSLYDLYKISYLSGSYDALIGAMQRLNATLPLPSNPAASDLPLAFILAVMGLVFIAVTAYYYGVTIMGRDMALLHKAVKRRTKSRTR